ncbi:MAG: hypothetical protein HOF21_02415 [Nitrospina sp.]|jgi:fumarate reductase subunit D|nr:hypothetical protein [Nitrospina sp.]MBT5548871.1 hypothetical protein [Nitrospina sp.]
MAGDNQDDVARGKLLAVLSYVGILSIVPFIVQPNNNFAVAHGRQGLCVFCWFVAASFFSIAPVIGPFVFLASAVLCLVFMFIGMTTAIAGRTWVVPVLGQYFK